MSFFYRPQIKVPPISMGPANAPSSAYLRGDRVIAEPPKKRPASPQISAREHGLNSRHVLATEPYGVLFKVGRGWFDLRGFWCVERLGKVEVRRGSSKKVMRELTAAQRKELGRVRLNARRNGLR
ncbi:hypothetical protein [Poseidonocella sp. HB161398]|uniref:hypothetical protein n=1 Tax=Poseidonocella sp. HB161398 TaxID=2320855 RepID=UPI0011099D3E|nr:hypothetical protein [Poseidonocella sp. HB161398]